MKALALVLFALVLSPNGTALAREHNDLPSVTVRSCCEDPARWASRLDPATARVAITTEDGGATLLLTGNVAGLQLSERKFREVNRKLRNKENDEADNVLAQTLKTVVLASVRALIDHSVECPLRDLREVEYRGGRLILTTNGGDHLFEGIDVNDRCVLEGFSERDAMAFVNEFHRVRYRSL